MTLTRFVKFGLVGCTGIVIDFCITWFCKEELEWNKYLSSSFGFSFAVVNNYMLNRYFTFKQTGADITVQFLKFLTISLVGLALSNLLLILIYKNTGINFYLSKSMVIAIVFFWNYAANSLYTFKH